MSSSKVVPMAIDKGRPTTQDGDKKKKGSCIHRNVCGDFWEAGFLRDGDSKCKRYLLQFLNVLLIVMAFTVLILTAINVAEKFANEKINPTTKVSVNDYIESGQGLEFPQVVVCFLKGPAGIDEYAEPPSFTQSKGPYDVNWVDGGPELDAFCSNGAYHWDDDSFSSVWCTYTATNAGPSKNDEEPPWTGGVDCAQDGTWLDFRSKSMDYSCAVFNPSFEYDEDMDPGKSLKGTKLSTKGEANPGENGFGKNTFQDVTLPLKAFKSGGRNKMEIKMFMTPNIYKPDGNNIGQDYFGPDFGGTGSCFGSVDGFKQSIDENGDDAFNELEVDSVASLAYVAFFEQGHVISGQDLEDLALGINPNFVNGAALEASTNIRIGKGAETDYSAFFYNQPLAWISKEFIVWTVEVSFNALSVTEIEQTIAYDEISAISEIGGISGLLLGWKLSSLLVWMKWMFHLEN